MKRQRAFLLLLLTFIAGHSVSADKKSLQIDAFPSFDISLPQLVPEFTRETGTDVEVVIRDYSAHHQALLHMLLGKQQAGDVVIVDVEKIAALIPSNGLVSLSDAFSVDEFEDLFPAYAWAQAKGRDGQLYGIPVDLGPGVMYYRKDLFELAGVNINQAIKSWDSYIEAGEKLKEHGISLIASADDVAHTMIVTTVPEGESVYFDKSGDPVVTSERFVQAFKIAKAIRDKGLDANMHTLGWSVEWYAGFRKDKFATQLSGSWFLGHLENWIAPEKTGMWRASHLPGGVYGNWGGSFLVIPKQSDSDYLAAWELVKFLSVRRDIQLKSFDLIGSFPANKTTYDDEMLKQELTYLGGQPARLLFTDVVFNIKPVVPNPADNIARSIVINDALIDVLDNKKTIKEALSEADELIMRRTKSLRK